MDAMLFGMCRIEIPFDLVRKENNESERMGLNVGEVVPVQKFDKILDVEPIDSTIRVSIHTDPQLKPGHVLFWNDPAWRRKYILSIADLCSWIEKKSNKSFRVELIELHPGMRGSSSIPDLKSAIIALIDELKRRKLVPLVVVENRTSGRKKSVMGTVEDILKLAEEVLYEGEELILYFGFALDIQQLFTEYKKDPLKVVGGLMMLMDYDPRLFRVFHIHTNHKTIRTTDPIPWKAVAKIVRNLYSLRIKPKLLPEVHKTSDITKTITLFEKLALIQ